ncbi:Topoisomerase 1-associated factor 1 [Mortierella sp. GBA30]|nr:Topoisomerase 1-associated factor 1 [Mortierella sp. GBA30]
MDPDIESLLVSTCLALGGFEDTSEDINDSTQVYVMGDECLECLKDIKKFIKYYDEPGDNVVLTFLGKMGILEKDLIPIMLLNTPADNSTKERLVLACIELMVPMTWIIDYKALQQMALAEEDVSIVGNLYERVEILRGYKKAFLQRGIVGAVFAVMLKPLEVEYRMRSTRDQAVIRLGLSLFRNLVAIQDTESTVRGTMEQFISSIMQEQLLERFQEENVMALLITLASSAMDVQLTEWNAITLEAFYYIFHGVEPEDLIPSLAGRVQNSQLQELLHKEELQKKSQSTAGRKRHDRFGTTGEVRLQDGSRMVLHQKGALFASFENQLDMIKKPRARQRQKESDEYRKNVSKSGSVMLRNLAMTLLESCFNPFFSSLRRDIEMKREKLKEHHRGQYHFLMGFLLKFQRLHVDYLTRQYNEQRKTSLPSRLQSLEEEYQKKLLECDFDLVATAIETATVFQIIRFMRQEFEPQEKDWQSIRRAMSCLIELLSTLYAMFKSPNEDFRDASDNVQNNLYHEDATLELFLDLAKHYKRQSTKYLNTLVQMIHILLKTLENYSNSKSYMFILKKRAIVKRKKKEAKALEQQEGEQSEGTAVPQDESQASDGTQPTEDPSAQQEQEQDEDMDEESRDLQTHTLKEHQFVFKDFERRFATEQVVHTYCAFLENFDELDETQLHWAAAMFHRIAVNCRNLAVFYKLSTLQLFHQILQSSRDDAKRDIAPFITYLMHQFFKKMQEYPLLIVEVLFPRSRKVCLDINVGREEAEKLENEKNEKNENRRYRLMAMELQVDPSRSEPEQIKIAVMALLDDDKDDLVDWAIEILKDAFAKRQLMAFRSESELAENPELMYSIENVEDILIVPDTPARQKSLRIEPRFRLLLRLLKFTKDEASNDVQYRIPKDLPTDTIAEYQEMIETIVQEEPHQDHEHDYSTLIQRIKTTRKRASGGTGTGRSRMEKEAAVYHSAEYIVDSEEDEGEDYYEAEKELRKRKQVDFTQAEERHRRMEEENAKAKNQRQKAMLMARSGTVRAKALEVAASASGEADQDKEDVGEDEDDDDDDDDDDQDEGDLLLPPRSAINLDSDEDDDDEEKEQVQSMKKSTGDAENDLESDEDEDDGERSRLRTVRRVLVSDSVESDLEDVGQQKNDDHARTEPMSLTQRLANQTGNSNKRRIILDDSENEDEEDTHSRQGSPLKKRMAFEE